ncbi:MAG: tetratricopeptide repeat protein [Elusimicrobia bacterium]|nr:tetratricopeptide repeat protein [Elusimicrobiota bacterium]
MKRIPVFIGLCAALAAGGLLAPARAAFENMDSGPRAAALGGAFEALADDAVGLFYNPAKLARLARYEFSGAYDKMYPGLTDNSSPLRQMFALGAPMRLKRPAGVLGFGWQSFGVSGLYEERAMTFGYAYPVTPAFSAGINLRRLSVSYGESPYTRANPVFKNGYDASAYGLDAGVLFGREKSRFGFSVLNANEPDLGLKRRSAVPRRFNAGAGFQGAALNWSAGLTLFDQNYTLKTGLEHWMFKQRAAVRAGLNLGSGEYRNMALGLGYREGWYQIDYAFQYPLSGLVETGGSHQMSVTLRWGRVPPPSPASTAGTGPTDEQDVPVSTGPAVSEQKRVLAVENKKAGNVALQSGRYQVAYQKFDLAAKYNPEDVQLKDYLRKLQPVSEAVPVLSGNDKKALLMRNAIDGYFRGDDTTAWNSVVYASQLWPDDRRIGQLRELIEREFAESKSKQKLLPGINLVQQKLQEALELIYAGRYIAAINNCKEVLDLEPNNVTALTRLGSAYWAMGNKTEARKHWKRALFFEPNNQQLQQFLEQAGSGE